MNTQTLKVSLILLTVISVVCDTMLLPFYPQFFSQQFGIDSSLHVGSYIGVCCFTVMCAFPLWAKVARKVQELQLWVVTQIAAAILGVCCYFITDIYLFWAASQLMLVFKASYLLIYPFVLRLEEKDSHLSMIGLFSVLMHFGGIGGAILGGLMLDRFNPQYIFLIMAAGDLIQVVLCLYLISKMQLAWQWRPARPDFQHRKRIPGFVLCIGLVSMLVYFSAFVARPYFSLYWQQVTGVSSEVLAGLIYAIPAWIALVCLYLAHRKSRSGLSNENHIALSLIIGLCGLLLQGISEWYWVLAGRCLLGYSMFVVTVKLEVMLFARSEPSHYSEDFSKLHFMQNLGVIGASFSVSSLVSGPQVSPTVEGAAQYQLPFYVAAAGFAVTLLVFYLLQMRETPATTEFSELKS